MPLRRETQIFAKILNIKEQQALNDWRFNGAVLSIELNQSLDWLVVVVSRKIRVSSPGNLNELVLSKLRSVAFYLDFVRRKIRVSSIIESSSIR